MTASTKLYALAACVAACLAAAAAPSTAAPAPGWDMAALQRVGAMGGDEPVAAAAAYESRSSAPTYQPATAGQDEAEVPTYQPAAVEAPRRAAGGLPPRPENTLWRGLSAPTRQNALASIVQQDDGSDVQSVGGRGSGGGNTATVSPIRYTVGNPVLVGTVNIYNIFYGSWSDKQIATTENFFAHIGESTWWNTMTKYYYQASRTADKTFVGRDVVMKKSVVDKYSHGLVINGTAIPDIIEEHIVKGDLPVDTNAIYFFMNSPDVKERIRSDLGFANFCEDYCGYHVSWKLKRTQPGARIFYAMAGNPGACLNGCAAPANLKVSPNGDAGVDAMMSVIAHELVEAVSDPVSDVNSLRAWQDATGYENGDKCAWTYGVTKKDAGGATSNAQIGLLSYLIQQNWDPATQSCSMG